MSIDLNKPGSDASTSALLSQIVDDFVRRLLAHPFLVRCQEGTVTIAELRRFLIQQGKYSRHFTQYLCALMSCLSGAEDVLKLASNLCEELGYGDQVGGVPHSRLYANMLKYFDVSLEQEVTYSETQNLIDTMFMFCRQPTGLPGLGALCLGAEAVVPAVYARLMAGFRSCGVGADQLEFFRVHVDCDDGHAETMLDLISRHTGLPGSSLTSVLQAGETALNARLRFFDAIADGRG